MRSFYPGYRGLSEDTWSDALIREVSDSQALFFIYLISNPRQLPAGIFKASPEQMWSDFQRQAVSVKDIKAFLASYQERGKVVYDRGWCWVVNFVKHRREWNPSIIAGMKVNLERIESRLIFDAWIDKYRNFQELGRAMGEIRFSGDPAQEPDSPIALPAIERERAPRHLYKQQIEDVWSFWQQTMGIKATMTDTRRDKILSRFVDKVTDPESGEIRATTLEDCFAAITACSASDWHMGRDPKTGGKVYNSLEQNIFRNLGQFEEWLGDAYRARTGKGPAPGKPSAAMPRKHEQEKWEKAPKGRQRINPETMEAVKATPPKPPPAEEEEVRLQ